MNKGFKIKFIDREGLEYSYWILNPQQLDKVIEKAGFKVSSSARDENEDNINKVRVTGLTNDITSFEIERLRPSEVNTGIRLAPYVILQGDAVVYLNKTSLPYWAKLYVDNNNSYIIASSWLNKSIAIPGRHPENVEPLYDRIKNVFPDYKLEITIAALNELTVLDRLGRPVLELKASLQEEQKRVLHVGRTSKWMCGVIIKIGNNNITAVLVDLQKGEILTTNCQPNLHQHFGEDINERIRFAHQQAWGQQVLHNLLVNQIREMLNEMRTFSEEPELEIYRIIVVGGSENLHWLLGANIYGDEESFGMLMFTEEICTQQLNNLLQLRNEAEVILLPQMLQGISAELLLIILSLKYQLYNDYLLLYWNKTTTIVIVKDDEIFVINGNDVENEHPIDKRELLGKITQDVDIDLESVKDIFSYNTDSFRELPAEIYAGYLPESLYSKIKNLGNIYIIAAINTLLSNVTRQELADLKNQINYLKI